MSKYTVIIAPRAERDLRKLTKKNALMVAENLKLLRAARWPANKVKKLRDVGFWEIKTGDYRSLFVLEGTKVGVLIVIHRRDLSRTIKHINVIEAVRWLREKSREGRRRCTL